MPRIRTIKPEIFVSPQVMNLSLPARLLFFGLIAQADDEGMGLADARKLKATIFPADERIGTKKIGGMVAECVREGLIIVRPDGAHGEVYCIPTWLRHQKIDHPKPSIFRRTIFFDVELAPRPPRKTHASGHETPAYYPPQFVEPSANIQRTIDDLSASIRRGSEGSDRKDLKGSDLSAHAREHPEGARASRQEKIEEVNQSRDPKAEALKLAAIGMQPGDIVRSLPGLKLKVHDVEYWIRTSSGASA